MASTQDHEEQSASRRSVYGEGSPLLQSAPAVGALCTCGVVTVLAISWCILDFWNHKLSSDLFTMGDLRKMDHSKSNDAVNVVAPFQQFSYPLTLAFVQFLFMGALFLGMHWAVTQERPDLRRLNLTSDKRWCSLVVSHVFSIFWLQSLMMPTQIMSLGLFASSRAVEIPVAAIMRPPVLGVRIGKKTMQTTGLAFVAACTLYYAYAEMAGCVCILSGNGVALTGAAFWLIYGLILGMPAANAVCQEAILTQLGLHPLLLLGLQNVFAAVLFTPVLAIAYIAGWEDVGAAFQMMLSSSSVFMMVTWLCAQLALTSVVCVMMIMVVDSFWAIALRALRVIFWAMASLTAFYVSGPGVALSIASPRTSFWSFVICCGAGLAAAAIYTDRRMEDTMFDEKHTAGMSASEKA